METITSSLDLQFRRLHASSEALLRAIPDGMLFIQPNVPGSGVIVPSVGEQLLRSAAIVEQTSGGITANLWDDPFEWTLPETLSSVELIEGYLSEVETTRKRAFALVRSDADLKKEVVDPSGTPKYLFNILLETLTRASHFQGRAFATLRILSGIRLPQV
jgi:hypothetical protein